MPNHVTNRITYSGDRLRIKQMLDEIQNDKYGIGTIDFNKVIPMPESLNIEAGSRTDKGLKAYKDFIYVRTLGEPDKADLHIPEECEAAFLKMRSDVNPEVFALGRIAFQNIKQYGAPTWYEWCIGNWGTKWNAYDYYDSENYSENEDLRFQTAWSAPHPVIAALARKYPDISFSHEWADEDIGQNCGRKEYANGLCTSEYYPESRKDCIEFAANVMDSEPSDWELYLNASGTDYLYLGNETYECFELFSKLALFSNDRMSDADMPEGLHCYHLRDSEDGRHFCSLEPFVLVNFGGSIITKEPIDFGDEKYIALDDDSTPNFLSGNRISLIRFLNEDISPSDITNDINFE